jgi:hypothetical protein
VKVDVGFCHRADAVSPQFRRSLTMLLMRDARTKQRVAGEWDQESSANISAGRCNIVRNFLGGTSDWLWMLDSDMTFGVDILDRLLRTADPQSKPIVGGLCFGVGPEKDAAGGDMFNAELGTRYRAFPTLYSVTEGGFFHWKDYPANTVVKCESTGAACVLIHRRVLADPRWQTPAHPFPWFREAVAGGKPMSEDHFFFLKARQLGYPLHVDTGAKTGHVKPLIVDELFFDEHR